MSFAFLVGLLTVSLVAAGYLGWLALPPRRVCPECSTPTVPVDTRGLPELLREHAWRRWCAECGWEGLGRRGPDLSDGPVDHDSGFRWSRERADEAPTFRWAEPAPKKDADREPPAHRSGFTWASPDDRSTRAAHPSGFRWRGPEERGRADSPAPEPADDPSGFRWAESEEAR